MLVESKINHLVYVVDMSGSMLSIKDKTIKVFDDVVKHAADRSVELEQETRATIYVFSSGYRAVQCVAYDVDVLRLPSLSKIYRPTGGTALIDATIKAIQDLEKTATLYGEHAFWLNVLTDGEENSSSNSATTLAAQFRKLDSKGDWTYSIFVPNEYGRKSALRFGFPAENTVVWDTTDKGLETVSSVLRTATDNYMQARSTGAKTVKSLFQVKTVTGSQIVNNLKPLAANLYGLLYVHTDQRVDDFVYDHTGAKLIVGKAYYQLTKKETIQANKNIAIQYNNKIYSGPQARQLLGLPDHTVDVDPGNVTYKDYRIFVQSTALNRKLIGGTSMLLMH